MTTTEQRIADPAAWSPAEQHATAWHEGYTAGHAAGLAARPRRDVYLPTTRRWRHVQAGDVFVGKGGALWHVDSVHVRPETAVVTVRAGQRRPAPIEVDLDTTIDVLVQRDESDALELLAEQLSAVMITPDR